MSGNFIDTIGLAQPGNNQLCLRFDRLSVGPSLLRLGLCLLVAYLCWLVGPFVIVLAQLDNNLCDTCLHPAEFFCVGGLTIEERNEREAAESW